MGMLQSNCYMKNQALILTSMEIPSGLLNHALKNFNFILICYLLTKFEQSEATGPLFLRQTLFLSLLSLSSISSFFNYIYFPFFFYKYYHSPHFFPLLSSLLASSFSFPLLQLVIYFCVRNWCNETRNVVKDLCKCVDIVRNFHILELIIFWNISYAPIPKCRDISCCETCYVWICMRGNHPFVSNFLPTRREATPFKILSDLITHMHNSLVVFTSCGPHCQCLERWNLHLWSWGDISMLH
jgi:hypothetical protein